MSRKEWESCVRYREQREQRWDAGSECVPEYWKVVTVYSLHSWHSKPALVTSFSRQRLSAVSEKDLIQDG